MLVVELFAPLSAAPHAHHVINYENSEVYPSPLSTVIPPKTNIEHYEANFVFRGKFYSCHRNTAYGCLAYDVNNGSIADYSNKSRIISGAYILTSTVEINDKIWRVGGLIVLSGTVERTNRTEMMDEDSNWTEGPELPDPRSRATLVAVSKTQVLIFGGQPSGLQSYLYDDADGSFDPRAAIGASSLARMPAAFMTLPGIGQVVLAIRNDHKAITYDMDTDIWTMRPSLDLGTGYVWQRFGFLTPSQR